MKLEDNQTQSILLTDDQQSITTRANPNCPICHGTGLKKVFDAHMGVEKDDFCKCIYINLHRVAAEMRIKKLFGSQWEQYTFAAYDTGGDARNAQALRAARNYVNNFP